MVLKTLKQKLIQQFLCRYTNAIKITWKITWITWKIFSQIEDSLINRNLILRKEIGGNAERLGEFVPHPAQHPLHGGEPHGVHRVLVAAPLVVLVLLRQLDLLVEVVHPREEEGDGEGVAVSPVSVPVADLLPHRHLLSLEPSLLLRE